MFPVQWRGFVNIQVKENMEDKNIIAVTLLHLASVLASVNILTSVRCFQQLFTENNRPHQGLFDKTKYS